MTVEARKLHFIEEFIKLTDEKVISQMETLLRDKKKKEFKGSLKPMGIDEFKQMIDKSRNDVEQKRVTTQERLKQEIRSW
ncbi:MAG: hypothetical protein Q4G63_07440 [Bacteroidia bacterium]|nr:hypothetical protein [Bacteroidia bacterium]